MSIERKTVVDQIEIRPDGVIQVRFAKQIVDGDTVVSQQWHRTSFVPGCDVNVQLAVVNENLLTLGEEAVTEGVDAIKAHASVAWTPAVIAAYEKSVEKQRAAQQV